MKKIFFAALALAAMVSCSKEYTIDNNKQVIAFGEAFVNNGTRADYSSGKAVEAFKVYGTLTGTTTTTVQIFNGANVTKPDGDYYNSENGAYDSSIAWICNKTQYWVPNTTYNFAAIVDGVAENTTGLPQTIKFTVADGANNKDLLYATASASVDNNGTVTAGANGLVAFEFNHLLSKVMFTVNSNIGTGYSIKVTGITVTGVAEKGVYDVVNEEWAQDGTTTTQLTFGNQDAYETRQILPVNQALNVTIAYDIYYGSTKISSATKSGTIPSQTYAKKTVYNITATITANSKIEFTVKSVGGWTTGSGITL